MVLNKKNIMTTIILTGLFVPFILITDIFPFFRFGMFAEPIRKNIQTEKFVIYSTDTNDRRRIFDPSTIGINSNTFLYLCRNYYYRKETDLFARKIFISSGKSLKKLELLRTIDNSEKTDTIKIGTFINND